MLVKVARQEPRNDAKIFIVVRRQPASVALGLLYAASFRGKVAGDFEFWSCEHARGRDLSTPNAPSFCNVKIRYYGMTAVFNSPLRFFMCWNTLGRSTRGASPVMKSLARISPRAMVSRASRKKRGV